MVRQLAELSALYFRNPVKLLALPQMMDFDERRTIQVLDE
jgi:hypothetical protein